jgi:hypothetical protein
LIIPAVLIIYAQHLPNQKEMKKYLAGLLGLVYLLSSCGSADKSNSDAQHEEIIVEVTVAEFLNEADNLLDQQVAITGQVTHVCRHGGQRLFITGEDTTSTVKITTGEDIAEFSIDLEGEKITVTGIVKELRIDETYLAEWEAEIMEGASTENQGHKDGLDEHQKDQAAETDTDAQLERVNKLREEIAASEKGYLSDFWIETIEFKVLSE